MNFSRGRQIYLPVMSGTFWSGEKGSLHTWSLGNKLRMQRTSQVKASVCVQKDGCCFRIRTHLYKSGVCLLAVEPASAKTPLQRECKCTSLRFTPGEVNFTSQFSLCHFITGGLCNTFSPESTGKNAECQKISYCIMGERHCLNIIF